MTKLLFLTMLVFSPIYLLGQTLVWQEWEDGLEESKRTGKLIMLQATSSECHYCKSMQKDVFEDSNMVDHIQNSFIPVRVNLTKSTMPEGVNLTVSMTPSFYFLTHNLELVKFIPGSWNTIDFMELIEKVSK